MKIKLPNGSKKSNSNTSKSKDKVKNKGVKNDYKSKSKSKSKSKPSKITWEESGEEFIKTYINFKLIKINTVTFDIHLPNNFKMSNNSSLEEAKNKAILLLK